MNMSVTYWRKHLTLPEVSGALGDLGTFLPLVLALVKSKQLDLGTTLIFTGVYNIVTGWHFGIPMCVQPMKTIVAVAISSSTFTLNQVMLAGLFVSSTVLLLGITRLIDFFNQLISMAVVRGIQLAVGLQLAIKGLTLCLLTSHKSPDSSANAQWREVLGLEGLLLGLFGLVVCLVTTTPPNTGPAQGSILERLLPFPPALEPTNRDLEQPRPTITKPLDAEDPAASSSLAELQPSREMDSQEEQQLLPKPPTRAQPCCDTTASAAPRHTTPVPAALLLVLLGTFLVALLQPAAFGKLRWGPSTPQLITPSWHDLREGILRAGLAQLPLTSLNSVIAVSQLAAELFPWMDPARFRPSVIATSVGALNMAGCWLGALPCCHGAGGLAAQVKFGASSGAAPAILGTLKLVLGLAFGSSLAALLGAFPEPLLGSMLVFSGVELASSARKGTSARGAALMLLTAAAIMTFNDTGYGFVFGYLAYLALVASEYGSWGLRRGLRAWQGWRQQGHAV